MESICLFSEDSQGAYNELVSLRPIHTGGVHMTKSNCTHVRSLRFTMYQYQREHSPRAPPKLLCVWSILKLPCVGTLDGPEGLCRIIFQSLVVMYARAFMCVMIVQVLDCIPSPLKLNILMRIRLRHDALTTRGVTALNFPGSSE